VYEPTGLSGLVEGVGRFYALDDGYRIAHHPEEVVKADAAPFVAHEFATPEEGELLKVYEEADFRVFAFVVDHHPVEPAVGYRLEYRDKSAIITGDSVYTENLVRASKGADVSVSFK
jgi:ribonuclease Z